MNPDEIDKRIYDKAKFNGCTPQWYDGMFGWLYHCGCEDRFHCADQQCSALSEESASRMRHVPIPDFLPESI